MIPLIPLIGMTDGPTKFLQGPRPNDPQCLRILPRSLGLTLTVHPLITVPLVLQLFLDPTSRILVSSLLKSLCKVLKLPIIKQAPLLWIPPLTIPLVNFPLQY